MAEDLRDALDSALCGELAATLSRIVHCILQLSDEQIWSRSAPNRNSIGNLILHVCGNLHQLVESGIGGAADDRDRPAEFAERELISSDELLGKLLATVKRAQVAIRAARDEALCATIPVKRFDFTGIQAVVRSISHFQGHAQEIIHITRDLLGEKYEFAGPR